MKRIALKVLAVSRQQRGSAGLLVPVLILAVMIIAAAFVSVHPAVSATAELARIQHIPHIDAIVGAALFLIFLLLLQVYPTIACSFLFLVAVATVAHVGMSGAMQVFQSQISAIH